MMERIELKAAITVDDAGAIEGLAWPFGAPDRYGDEILPGSFKGAVGPLPMLAFHEQRDTVGVWDSITETAKGLVVKGRLLVDHVARAAELRALIKAGALGGLSIGFVSKSSKARQGGGRTISKAELLEISIVAIPAHPGARITSAKGARPGKEGIMPENEQVAAPEIAELETKLGALDETVKGLKVPDISPLESRLAELEKKANRPTTERDATEPTEERKAFGTYLRQGDRTPVEELKTLTVSGDPQGGYLAPAELSTEFIRDLVEFSPIRPLATVRSTTAPSVSYPRRTGITNAKWKGETQAQEASEPTFGQVDVPIREINTFVDISNQLLADSGGAAEAEVRLALAEDFGQKEGLAFVKGSTNLEPEGVMSNGDVLVTKTGNASTLGSAPADLLISHMYSLPAAYRARGTWLMNGSTLAAIRKLKDGSTGVYLWQPSYQAGQPETILGRPVIEVPDMDDVGAAAEPILFGDIATAYRIVDRVSLSILVNPYIQATNGITRIHATRRVGAAVVQPAAIRKIVCATL